MEAFGPAARTWFAESFERPTPVQARGWREIAAGSHALLIAPTGSGKTLAAFLWCDRPADAAAAEPTPSRGVRVLYVSPLKALVYDVERNLRAPLVGIAARRASGSASRCARRASTCAPATRRRRSGAAQARDPAEILVTTPESLYLLLGSRAREHAAQRSRP